MKVLLWVLLFSLVSSTSFAQVVNPPLEVSDASANVVTFPYNLKFPNGSVIDNGDSTTTVSFTDVLDYVYFKLNQSIPQTTATSTVISNVGNWTFSGFNGLTLTGCPVSSDSSASFNTLAVGSTSQLTVDASGQFNILKVNPFGSIPSVYLTTAGWSFLNSDIINIRTSNTGYSGVLQRGIRSRGTPAIPVDVVSNDRLWALWAQGYYNSGIRAAASIEFYVDPSVSPASSNVPGQIRFNVSDTSSTLKNAWSIDSQGNLYSGLNGTATNNILTAGTLGAGATTVTTLKHTGLQENIVAYTGTHTIADTEDTVTESGTYTVNLLTAVGRAGKLHTIKNIGTGVITIACNGAETIDGVATYVIRTTNSGVQIISDNANWLIKGVF